MRPVERPAPPNYDPDSQSAAPEVVRVWSAPGATLDRERQAPLAFEIAPLHPLFAAEIYGVDLREPPNAGLVAQIDDAMNHYAVVVMRDQILDDDQQLAFARAMGPLEPSPAVVDAHLHRFKHREMVDISNLEVDGSILRADDRRRMFNLGNLLWHSDSSFKPTPAKYSMLHARVIPPEGGETEFADMRAAWDALPDAMQTLIEPLVCDHSLIYSRALLGFDEFTEQERRRSRRCRSGWCGGMPGRAAAASTSPPTSGPIPAGSGPKRWR